jgi:hypothetical protein
MRVRQKVIGTPTLIPAHIPSPVFDAHHKRDLKGDALTLPLSRIKDKI